LKDTLLVIDSNPLGIYTAQVKDDGTEEADGHDEAIVPMDFRKTGVLRDDEVTFQRTIMAMNFIPSIPLISAHLLFFVSSFAVLW
tara:strand:+ start:1181 stop:1435 length:255 start_codon:yes stop_codon:yes gene_type:complete